MSWEIDYNCLEEIVPLKGNTITVTYANKPDTGGLNKPLRICQAMQAARKGHVINLNEQNQACYGGDYWCGFIPEPRPGHEEHLANKEHIYASLAVAKRSISMGPPLPTSVAKFMLMSPLEKTTYEPDLVLLFCLPLHAAKLLGLTTYNTGAPRQVYATGATCRGAISIPLMTGEPR